MEDKLNPMDEQNVPAPEAAQAVAPEIMEDATAVFTPMAADDTVSAHMDDLDGHINDNWLEEFLQQKQVEEDEAQAAAAEAAEEAAVEEALAVAEELTGWERPVQEEPDDEEEIGADPMAIAAAGLVAPEDRELEKILAQDWDATTILPKPEPEEIPQAPAVEEEIPYEEEEELIPDGKKRRPKMNRDGGILGFLYSLPHLLVTVVWLAIIVVIAVPLGRIGWLWAADVFAFGKEPQSITLTITEADIEQGVALIAQKLGDAGIVRYPWLFTQFAELTGKAERIDPGTYTLGSHLDYNALLGGMINYGPSQEIVELMFPEGYNCAQIFAKLEENNVCTVEELEEYAANGELSNYWFLEGVERGHKYCLEGYLSPNTYQFYTNDAPGRVLAKSPDAFEATFTDKMHDNFQLMQQRYANMLAANGYSSDYIDANPLTIHKVVTLASIVEKEMANGSECYTIASVFYNRLTNPGNHPYLGSDATVYYAIGDYFGEKDELTQADLDCDSPYNTRNHKGLPPGPICNPGIYAMYSALEPDDTDYYYFVYSSREGRHLFSSTLREHEQKLRELGLI